jgi:diguanylate cyclase (GGDEF)-like protein/putative nucleotidyltransferase with HDIG domain
VLLRNGGEQVAAECERPIPGDEVGYPLGAAAYASAVLQVNGEVIGTLSVRGKVGGAEFTSGDLKLLDGVASVAAPVIRNAQLYETVRQQADTDSLTAVYNHRRLQERLDEEIERSRRYEHCLTVVLVDVDGFKLFNDVYGHPIGDRVLQTVAQTLRNNTRATDHIGRYGGDEFMLILPETDIAGAHDLAQRMLKAITSEELIVNGARLPLAISVGIASFPQDATNKHELVAHADAALYESKRSGGSAVRQANLVRKDWLLSQGNTFSVLEGLVQAVDAKDHYTREHSEVVTDAALLLAERLNLSDETRRALRIAGLLHDVGKIGIPDHILKKPGRLTVEEYEIMKQHVVLSEMIIKGVPQLNDVIDAVAHHHERFDGTGYPYGKAWDEIPLLGRIMAVADAYSAMCMDRPYREGLSWPEARAELVRGAGTQFDPELARLFVEAMDEWFEASVPSPLAAEAVVLT